MVRPTGLEPVTYGLAYHYGFRRHCVPAYRLRGLNVQGPQRLGSGLYLHHFRWDTYSLYGSRLFKTYRRRN